MLEDLGDVFRRCYVLCDVGFTDNVDGARNAINGLANSVDRGDDHFFQLRRLLVNARLARCILREGFSREPEGCERSQGQYARDRPVYFV